MGVKSRSRAGFSLIEVSVVLVILGMMTAGGIGIMITRLGQRQMDETLQKMNRIEEMLLDYRRAYERLPCPADITLDAAVANFGAEFADPGTCTGAMSDGMDAVGGMVPTKTLQLPDDYAFDGWGHRIVYAVDKKFTDSMAFTTIPINDATPANQPTLHVMDASGADRTNEGVYVLVSSGKNGHGAYPRQGGSTLLTVESVNTNEYENCDCDIGGLFGSFDRDFVQNDVTLDPSNEKNTFDDVVAYATRLQLRSLNE